MARPIEHRTTTTHPAARVFAALTSEDFLRARLRRLGGKSAELTSFTSQNGITRYVMRQTVDAEHIPPVARTVLRGDLVIARTEEWTSQHGLFDGMIEATVPGSPASARGVTSLLDTGTGSELLVTATVKVSIPLVGGKIEALVADQLVSLLRAEGEFTQRWLESR
jgi:hypothetical protein